MSVPWARSAAQRACLRADADRAKKPGHKPLEFAAAAKLKLKTSRPVDMMRQVYLLRPMAWREEVQHTAIGADMANLPGQ